MTVQQNDYEAVLAHVRTWPLERQLALIHTLLRLTRQEEPTLPAARGLLATGDGSPTDTEIAALLAQHRWERLGR